jgi:hypothetical protein
MDYQVDDVSVIYDDDFKIIRFEFLVYILFMFYNINQKLFEIIK